MLFEIRNRNLANLYTKGRSSKYRLPQGLARIFVERINRIKAAHTIYDLRDPPSMQFKKLEGSKNKFSIRLNKQYRLEFEIAFEDEEKTRGKVMIVDITKHYE